MPKTIMLAVLFAALASVSAETIAIKARAVIPTRRR